jgi:hypothetical protein
MMMEKNKIASRKILVLLLSVFILSGCTTYKFQRPADSAIQGYLVSYDGKPILEYTVGQEKSLPDLALAKERFGRRKPRVEYYYKQMGQIEARLKGYFWNPPVMLVDFLGSILRWPFIAMADYKYNHNSAYKEKVDKLDEEKEVLEKARIDSLKEELNAYIIKDLAKESLAQTVVPALPAVSKPVPEVLPVTQTAVEIPLANPALEPPVAVIIAKPAKGYSPLKVNFSCQKSSPKSAKIVSYNWDFGDGDTSTKKNPENTYWSTTYGSRNFTVTLTVRDEQGSTSSSTRIIEVATR